MIKIAGLLAPAAVAAVVLTGAAFCPTKLCSKGTCGIATTTVAHAAVQDKPTCPSAGSTQDSKSTSTQGTPGCCAQKSASTTGTSCAQKTALSGGACCAKAAQNAAAGCPKASLRQSVLASRPGMSWRVDGQLFTCPVEAEQVSKAAGKPIEYVVGESAFTDQDQAQVKLAALVEEYANGLLSLQFAVGGECFRCPVSADEAARKSQTVVKYRVAGVDFDTREAAAKALEAAMKAADATKLTFKVGDKVYPTAEEASKAAVNSSNKVTYVIGAQEAACEASAKLILAQTRVEAIVSAAVETRFGAIASATVTGK